MTANLPDSSGSAQCMEAVQKHRQRVLDAIPSDLRLPKDVLCSLPYDVTGVPESCGLLSKEELEITQLDATAIRDQIVARKLTAVQAVTAFGKRAAIAHQVTTCLVDYFLDEGIEQARKLDEHLEKTGQVVGPLHGVPISIKDHIPIKGRWASNGFLNGVHISETDCDMTAALRKLGAVFYVKTNQPQTIMHLETHSVYGRTLNPYNTRLTPGGSSGGESALVAMKGSPWGVGTDGGGSIRNPCAHTGLYGMRPTYKTNPTNSYEFYQSGAEFPSASTGPMCTSLRDVDLFMSLLRATKPHEIDPSVIPLDWEPSKAQLPAKLRIGVMRSDGVVLPQPPMLRGFDTIVDKLKADPSVEVKEFKPYNQRKGWELMSKLYFADGGKSIRDELKAAGEEPLPLTQWWYEHDRMKDLPMKEFWDLLGERDRYCRAYRQHWTESEIDVLLCPPYPGTAALHDQTRWWGYTAVYNLLDYPGIVFPTGLYADPAIDKAVTRSEFDSDPQGEDKATHEDYSPELYERAPISLQLLAPRFEDNRLVAAMARIEGILKPGSADTESSCTVN